MLGLSLSITATEAHGGPVLPPSGTSLTLHFDARRIAHRYTLGAGAALPPELADLSGAFPAGSGQFRIEPPVPGLSHDGAGQGTGTPLAPFAAALSVRARGADGSPYAYSSFVDVLPAPGAAPVTAGAGIILDPSPLSDPAFQRPGPYWPQIVDISAIAPAGTPPLMLLASSDHADPASPAAGLYVWRGSDPAGPWSFDGQFFASDGASDGVYAQMEAPTARVLEDPADGVRKLFIAAHYIPPDWAGSGPDRHIQIHLMLVSADGVTPPVPRDSTAVDGRLPAFDSAHTPYDEHRGYLTFAPNPFPALTDPATGAPWPWLGNGLYGSGANAAEMQGRALWGFADPGQPPELIQRVADEDAYVWNGARTRPALVHDIGAYGAHPDGGRWGVYLGAGHELRAVRVNDAGVAIRRGVTLFSAATDLPALPAALTGYNVEALETVFIYRHRDGTRHAVIGARMRNGAGAEANAPLIVPLSGQAPPVMTSKAKAKQGWDSLDIEELHAGFAALPPGFSGDAVAQGGDLRLTPQATDWARLGWTSPEPLERYQYLAFQVEEFGDVSGAVPAHEADLWCMAAPGASVPDMGADGLYAGSDGSAGEGRAQAVKLIAPDTLATAPRSTLSEVRTGRDGGQAGWRYALGLGIWPRGASAEWGVLHEGVSLARWGGRADEFDYSLPWTFAVALRRADPLVPVSCAIGRLRLTGKLHDTASALPPLAPRTPVASAEAGQTRLIWTPSRHSGGLPRTGHRIEQRPQGGVWSVLVEDTGSGQATALTGALSGAELRVAEITGAGLGAFSAPVAVP